jgi:hypothetical protein
MNSISAEIKIADEVFLATALLHRENPKKTDFWAKEIIQRVRTEFGDSRQSVAAHVSGHCVANLEPNGGRYRILYKTSNGNRRLLMPADDVHPSRRGKIFPEPEDVPDKYRELIDWAKQRYERGAAQDESPLLTLVRAQGMGGRRSQGEIDDFVRQLREGWD